MMKLLTRSQILSTLLSIGDRPAKKKRIRARDSRSKEHVEYLLHMASIKRDRKKRRLAIDHNFSKFMNCCQPISRPSQKFHNYVEREDIKGRTVMIVDHGNN